MLPVSKFGIIHKLCQNDSHVVSLHSIFFIDFLYEYFAIETYLNEILIIPPFSSFQPEPQVIAYIQFLEFRLKEIVILLVERHWYEMEDAMVDGF